MHQLSQNERLAAIAAIAVVFVAGSLIWRRFSRSPLDSGRAPALQGLAARLGMRYAQGISAPLPEGFALLSQERSLSAMNWLVGIRDHVWVAAFDVWWTSPGGMRVDGYDTNHYLSAVYIPDPTLSAALVGELAIGPRGLLDKLLHGVAGGARELGPPEFRRRFSMHYSDGALATDLVESGGLAAELLAMSEPVALELREGGLVVTLPRLVKPDEVPALIDRARALHARVLECAMRRAA